MPLRARPATHEELLRFHSAAYVDRVRSLAEAGGGDAGEARASAATALRSRGRPPAAASWLSMAVLRGASGERLCPGSAQAANEAASTVHADLYLLDLVGAPTPSAGIDTLVWCDPVDARPTLPLAPLSRDIVLPMARDIYAGRMRGSP